MRGTDTLCIPTISLYYTGSYLHDLHERQMNLRDHSIINDLDMNDNI